MSKDLEDAQALIKYLAKTTQFFEDLRAESSARRIDGVPFTDEEYQEWLLLKFPVIQGFENQRMIEAVSKLPFDGKAAMRALMKIEANQ